MMSIFLPLLFSAAFAQADQIHSVSPQKFSINGICVSKEDPNLDPVCSMYSDELTCTAYPFCRWIEAEKLEGLFHIYVEEEQIIQ